MSTLSQSETYAAEHSPWWLFLAFGLGRRDLSLAFLAGYLQALRDQSAAYKEKI